MKLSHRVRVRVGRTRVVETARGSLRSRILTRLLGNRYGIVLVVPQGANVEAVEIVESDPAPP